MARRGFVVQQAPVRHGQHPAARIDRKPAPRRIRQAIALRVAGIGVRPAHRPHHGPRHGLLRHAARRQRQVRGRRIHIRDVIVHLNVVDE